MHKLFSSASISVLLHCPSLSFTVFYSLHCLYCLHCLSVTSLSFIVSAAHHVNVRYDRTTLSQILPQLNNNWMWYTMLFQHKATTCWRQAPKTSRLLIDLIQERVARKSLGVIDMWWVPLIVNICLWCLCSFRPLLQEHKPATEFPR